MNRTLFVLAPAVAVLTFVFLISMVIVGDPFFSFLNAVGLGAVTSIGRAYRWRKLLAETGEEPKWYR